MELVLTAIGLVLVLEGLLYAAFPNTMRRMVAEFLTMPEATVRWTALTFAAVGVGIIWLARN